LESGKLPDKSPKNTDRIGTDRAHDGHKLKDIEPPLATFVFGDERLGLPEPSGKLLLRQAGLPARCSHKLAEGKLVRRMDGFLQAARARCHRHGKLMPLSDYPKRGCLFTIMRFNAHRSRFTTGLSGRRKHIGHTNAEVLKWMHCRSIRPARKMRWMAVTRPIRACARSSSSTCSSARS
jgi:hypothetical protein